MSDDPLGRAAKLSVSFSHRPDCTFGPGPYRFSLKDGSLRYCQTEKEVRQVYALLEHDQTLHVDRDGYCLDGDRSGDANTPDVVDAEQWLSWPRERAMAEVGLTSETDYRRVYNDIESAVSRRNNREKQSGVHASIVIKRKGRPLIDVLAEEGLLG